MKPILNIAFDYRTPDELVDFVQTHIAPLSSEEQSSIHIKVNDLIALIGTEGLKNLQEKILKKTGVAINWMIDGKWLDIPNTVANYVQRLDGLNVAYYTVHASGGAEMIYRAKKTAPEKKLLAVTVLTSMTETDTSAIYDASRKDSIIRLAKVALDAGADGLVCAPFDVPMLREIFGNNFLIVTPNIQREGIERQDDQNRALTSTPRGTIENGASDIVVGRPILMAENPTGAISEILTQMNAVNRLYLENREFVFEKILHTKDWETLLKYIGAIYRRPQNGAYVRLASKLISDGYINVGATERDYRVLDRASYELATQLQSHQIHADIVIGAQMGSVRLSETLARSLGITTSIYTEKDGEEMGLKRHDLGEGALAGKKVILSEDVITKGSTLAKMIEIVENGGGSVVAVTCVVNRSGHDNYQGIPLYSCYTPPVFGMWHDDSTPPESRGDIPYIPEDVTVIEKPKNSWNDLVQSMR